MVLHLSFCYVHLNVITGCSSVERLQVSVDRLAYSVFCLVTPYMVLAYHS